jgi:hypothetical protein
MIGQGAAATGRNASLFDATVHRKWMIAIGGLPRMQVAVRSRQMTLLP